MLLCWKPFCSSVPWALTCTVNISQILAPDPDFRGWAIHPSLWPTRCTLKDFIYLLTFLLHVNGIIPSIQPFPFDSPGWLVEYKDCLKANLKKCDIEPNELEDLAADWSGWRSLCKDSVQHFEANRIQYLEAERSQRKSRSTPNNTDFQCDICGRACASRIGLYAHRRSHLWSEIRDTDGSVHHKSTLIYV